MAFSPKVQERVDALRELLHNHAHRYYVLDEPEIPDAEYDKLFRELQAIEQAHPELVSLDSPTQRVGARGHTEFAPVAHAIPMLSLNNALGEEEAAGWVESHGHGAVKVGGDGFYDRARGERLEGDGGGSSCGYGVGG